jgi:hypothetical protein
VHQVELSKEARQHEALHLSARRLPRDMSSLDLRAGRFYQLTVMNAGRTDRFARAAVQALPHLFDETRAQEIESRFSDRFDETNPAAGTRRFCHSFQIRRTGRQA